MNGYEVLRRQIRSLEHALGESIRDAQDHYREVKRLRDELTAMTLERDALIRAGGQMLRKVVLATNEKPPVTGA